MSHPQPDGRALQAEVLRAGFVTEGLGKRPHYNLSDNQTGQTFRYKVLRDEENQARLAWPELRDRAGCSDPLTLKARMRHSESVYNRLTYCPNRSCVSHWP